jgi:ammonia channel protein AmtB
MNIRPVSAMIIGSLGGVMTTLGFQYLTPLLKKINLHIGCGVVNLHGLPGIFLGIISAIVASMRRILLQQATRRRIWFLLQATCGFIVACNKRRIWWK